MRSLKIGLIFILFGAATFMARGQVPRLISYQGLYTDTLGVPKPDGIYIFTFRFYADSVGGNTLWPPERRPLQVKRGLFSVLLGGQPGFESVFSAQRWMSLQVDPDPEIERRIQLASTAYAFRAIRADTALFALNTPLQQVADSARIAGTVPNNSITSAKILDATILRADVVPTFKAPDADIADTVRRAPQATIPPGSIDSTRIGTGAIVASKIATGAVTTAKIFDGAVTQAKIAPSVSFPPSGPAAGDLTGTFPSPTIAPNAVTTGKIADGTILFQDIGQNGAFPGAVMKWAATGWRADTAGGGISGSGSPGQVAFWNSAGGLSGNSNLFWNNGNFQLGIGVPAPSMALDVIGTARLRGMPVGGQFQVGTDDQGVLFRLGSSRRYKTDIHNLKADFSRVLDLQPVKFRWKSDGREDVGLIAEDVDQKVKDLVIYDDQQRPDGVKYDRVALYLLSVVKDQQEQIKQLQAAVKFLQDKIPTKSSLGELK